MKSWQARCERRVSQYSGLTLSPNTWGRAGEDFLTKKYKDQLPEGFTIKITNPGGFIIMGRDENLTEAQRQDFEVVKRKYKSVIDIITYDEMLRRLKFTIDQLREHIQYPVITAP